MLAFIPVVEPRSEDPADQKREVVSHSGSLRDHFFETDLSPKYGMADEDNPSTLTSYLRVLRLRVLPRCMDRGEAHVEDLSEEVYGEVLY